LEICQPEGAFLRKTQLITKKRLRLLHIFPYSHGGVLVDIDMELSSLVCLFVFRRFSPQKLSAPISSSNRSQPMAPEPFDAECGARKAPFRSAPAGPLKNAGLTRRARGGATRRAGLLADSPKSSPVDGKTGFGSRPGVPGAQSTPSCRIGRAGARWGRDARFFTPGEESFFLCMAFLFLGIVGARLAFLSFQPEWRVCRLRRRRVGRLRTENPRTGRTAKGAGGLMEDTRARFEGHFGKSPGGSNVGPIGQAAKGEDCAGSRLPERRRGATGANGYLISSNSLQVAYQFCGTDQYGGSDLMSAGP